jgi:hypothetical protein
MRAPAVITLSIANVSKIFKQVNIHKAAGPNGLPGCVLRACVDQLASALTDILSLTESLVPTCFKQTTIVPVPKEAKATCLNLGLPGRPPTGGKGRQQLIFHADPQ